MAKVLVTPRSLKTPDHPALASLREAGHEIVLPSPGVMPTPDLLRQALPGCAGWLAGAEKITADIMDAAPGLKIISRNGVGIDNVDIEAAKARGIAVANTPGANARGVAELALALIFALARNIAAMDAAIKAGGWERRQGMEIEGKMLGVIGCGQIGKTLVRLAVSLGMNAVGFDLYPDASFQQPGFSFVDPDQLARQADIISVHIPGGDKPFVDAAFLAKVRKGVLIVNTARATAVDNAEIIKKIADGTVGGYGVDAFETEPPGITPLTSNPRVVCTSHVGGFTAESVMRAVTWACKSIVDALR